MQILSSAAWCVVILITSSTRVQGCTILGFTNHSFSANVVRLLHALPIFEGQNGTLYLDSTASSHKCHPDGGIHEFFSLGKYAGDCLLVQTTQCLGKVLTEELLMCL